MSENKHQQSYHLQQYLGGGALGSAVALEQGIVLVGPLDGNINSQQMKCVTDEKAGGVVNHAENRAVIQSD